MYNLHFSVTRNIKKYSLINGVLKSTCLDRIRSFKIFETVWNITVAYLSIHVHVHVDLYVKFACIDACNRSIEWRERWNALIRNLMFIEYQSFILFIKRTFHRFLTQVLRRGTCLFSVSGRRCCCCCCCCCQNPECTWSWSNYCCH